MKLHVNLWMIVVLMLNVISLAIVVRFRVRECKFGVLIWTPLQKNAVSVLIQGEGCHPNDALVVIALEAQTGDSYLTGRLSRSPDMVGWDGRHWDDEWGGMWGWWALSWWRVTRHTARISIVHSVLWIFFRYEFWCAVVNWLLFGCYLERHNVVYDVIIGFVDLCCMKHVMCTFMIIHGDHFLWDCMLWWIIHPGVWTSI